MKSALALTFTLTFACALGCGSSERSDDDEAESTAGSGGTTSGAGGATAGDAGTGGGGKAGSSAGSGVMGGSGGGAGTGAGATATGGTAGSAGSAPTSEYEACVSYYKTACHKRFGGCGIEGSEESCVDSASTCPDRYFSEGSRVTIEDLVACTEVWANVSCDDIRQLRYPDCLPPGDKAVGEACLFAAQCASFFCAEDGSSASGCGVCGTVLEEGDTCPESGPYQCGSGLFCTGSCVAAGSGALGELCAPNSRCEPGSYCTLGDDDSLICKESAGLGESCADRPCVDGAYCQNNGSICTELPGVGEPCVGTTPGLCAAGAGCDDASPGGPTCAALLGLGEACLVPASSTGGIGCEPGLICWCDGDACAAGNCIARRTGGEPCGPYEVCLDGTHCEASICVSDGFQDLFAAACE